MLILLLQSLLNVPKLACGILALLVARQIPRDGSRPLSPWRLVGIAFCVSAACGVVQSVGAAWAVAAGPSSAPYELYLRIAPAANHSRAFLAITLGAVLALLPWVMRLRARETHLLVLLLVGMSLGAWAGWAEGPLTRAHTAAIARNDMVEMWVMLSAVLVGLVFRSLDRLLWVFLLLYALRQSWNAIWFSAFGWAAPAGWVPSQATYEIAGIAAWMAMCLLAYHRLRLARRGIPVPALLEPFRSRDDSIMGWK